MARSVPKRIAREFGRYSPPRPWCWVINNPPIKGCWICTRRAGDAEHLSSADLAHEAVVLDKIKRPGHVDRHEEGRTVRQRQHSAASQRRQRRGGEEVAVARPVDKPLRVTRSARSPGVDKESGPVPRGGDGRADERITLRGSPPHNPRLECPCPDIAHRYA